ncbi:MAG: sigma-70 family RNA polymerase sigma factor [Planctomycetes bacterium]|nr:sigma-70 family RNA polymerase sigma factor [Planctomycetota bacterium]MCH9727658.1 sigma-70 family RNA polymerase sigma factor [Planctomycetota bacterium]MCH9775083.1 sigma-70 family RNA polymerase sigma factor [Planctomycetota bacterium]MCH9789599.1 sigma-70 family RNA polymerase sigma factor [Planctomycetota bacterium]
MDQSDNTELFVQELTENQNRLYGYVYSLLGDHGRAEDVLQETNLVLWRKIGEYDPERPFLPWAFAIVRFQVLAQLRDKQRDRLLLDPHLAEMLSDEAAKHSEQIEIIREALRPCMGLLTPANRELIEERYFRARPVADIGNAVNRSASAVKVALLRIRRQLADCVQKRMAAES